MAMAEVKFTLAADDAMPMEPHRSRSNQYNIEELESGRSLLLPIQDAPQRLHSSGVPIPSMFTDLDIIPGFAGNKIHHLGNMRINEH